MINHNPFKIPIIRYDNPLHNQGRTKEDWMPQEGKMAASINNVIDKTKEKEHWRSVKGLELQSFYGYNTQNLREFIAFTIRGAIRATGRFRFT